MNPDQARNELTWIEQHHDGARGDDVARDALATIAAMREEWGVIYDSTQISGESGVITAAYSTPWGQDEAEAMAARATAIGYVNARAVRCMRTEWEEA